MRVASLAGMVASAALAVACGQAPTPEPAPVGFAKDVQPILARHCLECHSAGQTGTTASGLRLDGYGVLMEGTRYGAVVVPGDPTASVLNTLVEGRADPSLNMPHAGRDKLAEREIRVLRDWVKQGAPNN